MEGLNKYLFGKKTSPLKQLQSFEENKPLKVDYKDVKKKKKAYDLSNVIDDIKGFFKPKKQVKPKKVYSPIKYKLFSPNSDPNKGKVIRGKNLSPGKPFNYKEYKEQKKNLLLLKGKKIKYDPDFQPVLFKIAKKGRKVKKVTLSDIKEGKYEDFSSPLSNKKDGILKNIKHKVVDIFGDKKAVKKYDYIPELINPKQNKYSPKLKPVKYRSPNKVSPIKYPSPKIEVLKTKKEKKIISCPPGKIYNPQTERCVKADGKIGKLLARNKMSPLVKERKEIKDKCPTGKVFNPATGRCVDKNGKIGKKLLGL